MRTRRSRRSRRPRGRRVRARVLHGKHERLCPVHGGRRRRHYTPCRNIHDVANASSSLVRRLNMHCVGSSARALRRSTPSNHACATPLHTGACRIRSLGVPPSIHRNVRVKCVASERPQLRRVSEPRTPVSARVAHRAWAHHSGLRNRGRDSTHGDFNLCGQASAIACSSASGSRARTRARASRDTQ